MEIPLQSVVFLEIFVSSLEGILRVAFYYTSQVFIKPDKHVPAVLSVIPEESTGTLWAECE